MTAAVEVRTQPQATTGSPEQLHACAVAEPDKAIPGSPRKAGRPRVYDDAVAEEICIRIGDGEALHAICAEERMPHAMTVCRWKRVKPEFAELYEAALLAKFDKRCEEMQAIAADSSADYECTDGSDGMPRIKPNKEAVARSQLRIDTLKWIMARELPQKYSEQATAAPPSQTPSANGTGAASNVIDIKEAMEQALMRPITLAK